MHSKTARYAESIRWVINCVQIMYQMQKWMPSLAIIFIARTLSNAALQQVLHCLIRLKHSSEKEIVF